MVNTGTDRLRAGVAAMAAGVAMAGLGGAAIAQEQPIATAPGADRVEQLIAEQNARISRQEAVIAEQQRQLGEMRTLIDALMAGRPAGADELEAQRGGGRPAAALGAAGQAAQTAPSQTVSSNVTPRAVTAPSPDAPATTSARAAAGQLPTTPVGEAPPPEEPKAPEAMALPEGSGVLTPRGRFVFDPSFEYSRSSSNRLVFRGVEIVTGIQIGVIEASDADRDTLAATAALRYGVTSRLEVEARIPYIHRSDRVTVLAQRDDTVTRTLELEASGIGDVEASLRYQLTSGASRMPFIGRLPILIANLRYKSETGTSPFEVDRDAAGVATELATGSGFWAVEPSISFLVPSDPVVIFGSLSYLYHAPKNIDQTVGSGTNAVHIGEVDPGDSIGANVGFGFALNPRFSFSLGYRHNYIFPTESELGEARQRSNSLQVGGFLFGWSYRLTERLTLGNNFEFGVTADSPDVRISLRLPYRF
jgi:hypothetical protein